MTKDLRALSLSSLPPKQRTFNLKFREYKVILIHPCVHVSTTRLCRPSALLRTYIANSDVLKLLSSCKTKSCPLDPLPALMVLKECFHTLLPVYTRLINLSLNSGTMPETLKIAILSPLLKKINVDHNNFSSFRPVSNLKFLSKLIEKAVFAQLNEYLITNDLHEACQSAYKAYHS